MAKPSSKHDNNNGRCALCGHIWPCMFAKVESDLEGLEQFGIQTNPSSNG